MDYLIVAKNKGKELLGSANAAIVHNAKSQVKVNNTLRSFNPDKEYDCICIYSYLNIYNEDSYKLIRTIK